MEPHRPAPPPPVGPFYDYEENEYLLTGEYRTTAAGEDFIHPNVNEVCTNATGISHYQRWIVKPRHQCRSESAIKSEAIQRACEAIILSVHISIDKSPYEVYQHCKDVLYQLKNEYE